MNRTLNIKCRFKNQGTKCPSPWEETGFPQKLRKDGSTTLKEKIQTIIWENNKLYVVKFKDKYNQYVQLAFKKELIELLENNNQNGNIINNGREFNFK